MSPSNLIAGIALTTFAGFVFATSDAVGKYLTGVAGVLTVVWGRYAFQTLFMSIILARSTGLGFLRTRRPFLQIARGGSLLLATLMMYTALSRVPLADATAAIFLSPILVTILSVLVLGERIGIHRILAILAGFGGVLLIVRPGSSATDPAILLAIGAAFANAVYLMLTRALAGADDTASTQFNTTATGTLVLTLAILPNWQTPPLEIFVLMATMGALGTLSHFCLVKAFAHAPASLLSPFLYSQVLFAAFLSVFLFADPLHPAMVAGTLILVSSGLYIWWRETRTR